MYELHRAALELEGRLLLHRRSPWEFNISKWFCFSFLAVLLLSWAMPVFISPCFLGWVELV